MTRPTDNHSSGGRDDRLIRAALQQAREEEGTCPASAGRTITVDESGRDVRRAGISIEGYEILHEVLRGGQGVIYKAIQTSMKREVAIKVLLHGAFVSAQANRRFEREVELIASLRHTNIIAIHDSGLTGDGQPYYVMDFIDGRRLKDYVQHEQLTLEDTLRLFGKICDAVTFAHQHGVIHRDLKPSNILVDADGVPKVLDFGLAKHFDSAANEVTTLSGQVVGTLPYMAPEQARGTLTEIDTRTDVYALGVILYELLTGHYPYPVIGQMADVLRNIVERPPATPSSLWSPESGVFRSTSRHSRSGKCPIDDEVQTIVLRCLTKERHRRYESAGSLLRDIEHYLAGEAIEAKRDSTWYVLRKLMRRHTVVSVSLACVLITIISFGLISFGFYQETRQALNEKLASDELMLKTAGERDYAVTANAQPAVQRMAFGWFLWAWQLDQEVWATEIRDRTPKGPEHIAMTFLLDDAYSFDRMMAELPSRSKSLGYFADGERHWKAGRGNQAIGSLRQSLATPGDEWIKSAATDRLARISSLVPQTGEAGAKP